MTAEPATRMIQTRITDGLLDQIDQWRLRRGAPIVSRAEAIRRLLEQALEQALEADAAGTPGGE